MIRRLVLGSAVFLLLVATTARATTLARMSLDELTASADAVVRAQCLSSESRWEGGEIWTFTNFEVLEPMNGVAPRLLTVRLLGGQVGHLISTVSGAPRFDPGEEVILFLERTRAGDFSVTDWIVGTIRVHRDPHTGQASVTQDSSGLALSDPATHRFRAAGIRRLPLEVFRQRLAVALERARKGVQR
jgi:hypothetical protein